MQFICPGLKARAMFCPTMQFILKNFLFFIVTLISFASFAMPKAIILIRHAEKPVPENISSSLSERGWQRARLLPQIFVQNRFLNQIGLPEFLFAAGKVKEDSSVRSIETLQFLSKTIQVPVNDSFNRDEYKDLVSELYHNPAYNNKVVMICWQHKILSKIVGRLGVNPTPQMDDSLFDRIWLITYENNQVQFQDMPQHLLPGDSVN